METKASFIKNLRLSKQQEALGVQLVPFYPDEMVIKKIKEYGILRQDLSGINFNSGLSIAVNYTINSININQIFKKSQAMYLETTKLDELIIAQPMEKRMDFCMEMMKSNKMFLKDLNRNGKVLKTLGGDFKFKPYNVSIFEQNKTLIEMLNKQQNPEWFLRRGVIDAKMLNHPNYSDLKKQLVDIFPDTMEIISEPFPYHLQITNAFKDQTIEILLNENITSNIPDWLDVTQLIKELVQSFEPEPELLDLSGIISDTEKLKITDKINMKRKEKSILMDINKELGELILNDKDYITKGILKTKGGKSIFSKLRKEIIDYKKQIKMDILQTMGEDIKSVYILPKPQTMEKSPRQMALMERYRKERQDISIRKASEKNRANFENFKKRLGMYNKKTAAADLKIKKKFKRDNLKLRATPFDVQSEMEMEYPEEVVTPETDAEMEPMSEDSLDIEISDTEMEY